MKSKVVIKGHPLHPMLIPFPFAFLTGAILFDVLAFATGSASFWTTGGYLAVAGVASGLLAAVPGAVDYLMVVPPHSSGKQRATLHALCNVTALTSFGLAWLARGNGPGMTVLGLEGVGLLLLGAGGWMGGTLVYRNQIGVDHRYADAGRWREATLVAGENPRFIPIDGVDDVKLNQMKLLRINNRRRVVLGRTEAGCVAFDDRCTHRGGSLADGVMICGTVQCPWHGSQFDAATGAVKAGPATRDIGTYRIREDQGGAQLDLRPSDDRGVR